ncbi:MAG TPA: aspartate aminotransferase family protein [Polyangia bacterium]|jgi:ornithine--oxo-acid transaminase|nr:aspartate aminotransferase family protein [Polyangia bacterium]
MPFDLGKELAERAGESFSLHEKYLNPQMVRVLKTIGFDRHYTRAEGAYLFDKTGARYLDLLSGFGVFAVGRNHPVIKKALGDVLAADLPNLVQMDVSLLAGLLAERLLSHMPGQETVFFCNSGTEAVEAAIKLARAATRKDNLIFCDHAFHGLTMGALSLNGDAAFRDGFGALLAGATRVPWNDLDALAAALAGNDVAAFFVEPIQGKGVNLPEPGYLREAAKLCRKHGALFVADEVQTGLGRTGKFLACEHEDVDADLVLLAKALSGGYAPVGAVAGKKWIFERTFNRMDRAVVHGSTFAKNNLSMAAGLATLAVLEDERLIENAAVRGESLRQRLGALVDKYELLKEVRGRGLMLALEFGAPRSFALRAAWSLLEKATKGLFCQSVIIPLFTRHRILSQVAGHDMYVIKLLPPLCLSAADEDWIVSAFDDVIGECHKVPSSVWDLATTLAGNALKTKAGQ